MRTRTSIVILIIFVIAACVQLYVLRELDYSTSSIIWVEPQVVTGSKPVPNFQIGGFFWDVEKYSRAPELEEFRSFFNEHCSGRAGIRAASCLSENFVKRVPFGAPSDEIFLSEFSPTDNFKAHINGHPGHCVSYSAMTVNSLLSVGIPARFIQLLPKGKSGHNIIEVWDGTYGWVAFDPLSDSLISNGKRYLSAVEAHSLKGSVSRVEADPDVPTAGYLTEFYEGENPFDGVIAYPEPWLYTRIGTSESALVRSSMIAIGNWRFEMGMFQSILRYGIVLCIGFALLTAMNIIRLIVFAARA